jgi:multidrug efflux pump subunit AcrB
MRLPKLALENHQFTIVLVLLLVMFGFVSFWTMPRSEDPLVSPAGSSIIVIYPGATPADLEELVIDPIEEVINELDDIKKLSSTAKDGLAVVGVEFLSGSDPDDKYSDVVQKVNSIRNDLPTDVLRLEISKWSITDVQILQLALHSDIADYRDLEYEADMLKQLLERTAGIQKVKTWAVPEQEVRISVDLTRMAQFNIPLNQVIQAIQSANQNIPGGSIDIGTKKFNVQTSGAYQDLVDIRNTVVGSNGGRLIYLHDIAGVEMDYKEIAYKGRFNDQKAVFITVSQKPGTNIFDIIDRLNEKIDRFDSTLPGSMNLSYVFNQSESVSSRISSFFMNLFQGLILVGLVILAAVGIRAAIIVIIVVPISILTAIGFIDLSNFGLQQMTISGLVIALGLLVDNAIVVIENISRFMRLGYKPGEAAIKGTEQIAWAIVSSTATTVLAFVPMMMMRNITGEFIRSMPASVVYTLSASLLMALILTPYLASRYLHLTPDSPENRFQRRLNTFISVNYRKILEYALSKPKRIIAISLTAFVISLGLFPLIGISFFPKAEKPQFIINIDTPEGTSLDHTGLIARKIEHILSEYPGIRHFATNIGHGNPRIYYNVVPKNETSTHAQIFVLTNSYEPEPFVRLIDSLRNRFTLIPGVKIEVKEFEQGPPVEAPIAIRVIGEDLEQVRQLSLQVERIFYATPGAVNINNPLTTTKNDLHVRINREKAGILGVPLAEIDRTVRAGIAGFPVSKYRDEKGKEYDITVQLPVRENASLDDLNKVYVSSLSGALIPLMQIADLEFKASPLVINHYNMERSVTITSDVKRGYSVNTVTQEIAEKLDKINWMRGYRYDIGGEQESREESFGGMSQAVLVALIGIFGVLVLQFRSYRQPMIVFSAIPLALIGAIIALLLTNNTFSFTAFIGLTSLVGIVINNSIILVDYTNQLRGEGKDVTKALLEAGETRFTPIILTTATTVGGLLPLTLSGGTLWAPMGWTIIGGLIVSTLLTLILVPVLYQIYSA